MNWMDSASDLASIASLVVSVFVATKVVKISNSISIKGGSNVTAGRDANVGTVPSGGQDAESP